MMMREFQAGVRELVSSPAALEEKLGRFVRLVSGFLGGAPTALFLADRGGAGFTLRANSGIWRCEHGEIWHDAAATIEALALEEERLVHLAELERPAADGGRQAERLVFPLVAFGERAGVLTVERVAPRRMGEGRRVVLAEAIRRFAETLVQEQRLEALSRRLTRLSSLQEVGIALLGSSGVGELVRTAAFSAAFVLEAEAAVVRLYDPRSRSLAVVETHGLEERGFRERALALEERAVAEALPGGGSLLVADVAGDRRFAAHADAVRDFVCQPLGAGEGVGGAITVMNRLPGSAGAGGRLGEDDRALLEQLGRYLHRATRTALSLAARERARGFDAVTGLLSMRAFRTVVGAEIRRARRFNTRFLLLACDVTPVAAGGVPAPPEGREFLRTLGRRIRGAFREYDHVARAGPARFVVILPEVRDAMTGAAKRVEDAVGAEKDRMSRLGSELHLEIAFTQALFPEDGESWAALARVLGLPAAA